MELETTVGIGAWIGQSRAQALATFVVRNVQNRQQLPPGSCALSKSTAHATFLNAVTV